MSVGRLLATDYESDRTMGYGDLVTWARHVRNKEHIQSVLGRMAMFAYNIDVTCGMSWQRVATSLQGLQNIGMATFLHGWSIHGREAAQVQLWMTGLQQMYVQIPGNVVAMIGLRERERSH